MFTFPEIDPIIWRISEDYAVRWYGLTYVAAFLAGWWLARRRCERPGSPIGKDQVDDLVFWVMLGVIVGGRLGYVFFYGLDELLADPVYLIRINEGGMSFHGGLIGVILAMWLYARKLGKHTWDVVDFVAPLVPLGLGFGRIGNFINGELWGKPTDGWWGVEYRGEVLHASQLYESVLEGFVLFVILWWFSSKPRPRYAVSGMFLLFYGIFRFTIEFVRVPDSHLDYLLFGWVTMGQILTTPMIVAGAAMLAWAYRKPKEAVA